MLRRIPAVLAPAFIALACGSSSPGSLTCPTTAQSVTFSAAGSCSGAMGGTVTISTQPGLCSLLVKGGDAVNIPAQGQFTGDAATKGYDLTKGNWYLVVNEGNAASGSVEIQCDPSPPTATGVITLSCSGMNCPADDCGGGGECSDVDCVEHLTPM